MSGQLSNKVALVTGGSKGIGRAIATELANEGAKVVVTARGERALDDLVAEFPGREILAARCDVTSPDELSALVNRVVSIYGGIDILVNNVGGSPRFGSFEKLENIDWYNAFELNVMSVVNLVRAFAPQLRKSTSGRIINISSIVAVQPGAFNPHYSITKAAVVNLGKYLSGYFASDGVLVNTICPGPVRSDSWEKNLNRMALESGVSVEEFRERFESQEQTKIPLGRIGSGSDVAGLVAFLASEKAGWITGSCFHVNGGKIRGI